MPKGKQVDVGEKAKVMAWHAEGLTPKDIANLLNRGVSTIRKIINVRRPSRRDRSGQN
jgi:IS30 family transposase